MEKVDKSAFMKSSRAEMIQIEGGPAWVRQADDTYQQEQVSDRWLTSGRTVYNNKDKPVKQYEPFYSESAEYEPEEFFATYGVTPIIHYDPLLRVIRTDIAYKRIEAGDGGPTTVHVHSKVQFTPWQIKRYDANDTLLESEYAGISGTLTPDELDAFNKAAAHAHTPRIAELDTLGREFLSIAVLSVDAQSEPKEVLETHTTFDITGQPLSVVDPRQRVLNETRSEAEKIETFKYTYDMTGQTLRTVSIDAGDDRVLVNVMGNPVINLDARGHKITAEYDALHRPLSKRVQGGESGLNHLVEAMVYGEEHPNAVYLNQRGQLWKSYDPSGRSEVSSYDFKGQPLETTQLIRTQYRTEADWSGDESSRETLLQSGEPFVTTTAYDALGRVFLQSDPDGSETRPVYHPSGRLNELYVKLRGDAEQTRFVKGITYNARGQR